MGCSGRNNSGLGSTAGPLCWCQFADAATATPPAILRPRADGARRARRRASFAVCACLAPIRHGQSECAHAHIQREEDIYESTELFHRGTGETTDIVQRRDLHLQRPRQRIDYPAARRDARRGPRHRRTQPAGRPGLLRTSSSILLRISAMSDHRKVAIASTTSSASKPSAFPTPTRTSSAFSSRWTFTAAAA